MSPPSSSSIPTTSELQTCRHLLQTRARFPSSLLWLLSFVAATGRRRGRPAAMPSLASSSSPWH
ncbi:hypothetical protein E2562_005815 [Oryza meyeriana var. granulata]|uniref:Uncharacterized protein n=1 Tax=Oryza meyeriana var. granulata TaxID=110450 RepID=A0A6G1CEM4_9ORYZ|nr:hypothetical protein E2562_005815 [Oryza meyeriana var. granulata]